MSSCTWCQNQNLNINEPQSLSNGASYLHPANPLRSTCYTDKQAGDFVNLMVVTLDWLLDSVRNKQLEPEAAYALDSSSTPTGSKGNGVPSKSTGADSDASKNVRNATANNDVAKADDKIDNTTKKSATGKKRTRKDTIAIKDDPADNGAAEDSEPATKRFKDGQKAISASLSVPVDGGCHLSRKQP
jgi:hypothetical protein